MNTRFHGYSLTEIMMALVISSILMYGVITIMVSSKRTYALQDELAKLQDNARFIMEDISFALRMAGYKGCAYDSRNNMTNPLQGGFLPIGGENNELITNANGDPLEGIPESDILTIRYLSNPLPWHPDYVSEYSPPLLRGTDPICLSPDVPLPLQGENVIVSDCTFRDRYSIMSVSRQDGQCPDSGPSLTVNLKHEYKRPIDVFPMNNISISYGVLGFNSDVGGINFALFRTEGNSTTRTPFVEGVENMQIRYGIAKEGGLVYQDRPPTAADTVISVRMTLLMRTINKRFDIPDAMDKEFPLDPRVKYNPSENPGLERGYRHRLFSSVISIRNANVNKL